MPGLVPSVWICSTYSFGFAHERKQGKRTKQRKSAQSAGVGMNTWQKHRAGCGVSYLEHSVIQADSRFLGLDIS